MVVVSELTARKHCQSSQFTTKWAEWTELAVLFSWQLQNSPQYFDFFYFHGCQTFISAEIHCYLRALKSWYNNSFLGGVQSNIISDLSWHWWDLFHSFIAYYVLITLCLLLDCLFFHNIFSNWMLISNKKSFVMWKNKQSRNKQRVIRTFLLHQIL